MAAQPLQITSEDYLASERAANQKHEYWEGQIRLKAGAGRAHCLLVTNLVALLVNQLRQTSCSVYSSDMRVQVSKSVYTYPDVVIACNESFSDDQKDTLLNPILLFEVLSPSTENYDRGAKFEAYRDIHSLRDYITLAQDRIYFEHSQCVKKHQWLLTEYDDANEEITLQLLPSLEIVLPIHALYAGVLS